MCGICGMAGFKDEQLLRKMTAVLEHRGPDAEGFFSDEDVALGIRRLKVIDLATGDQPIHNEDRTLWIVYNGEIYNFQELKVQLQAKGHQFYTHSDTEVILHLYEEYGRDCVRKLAGMFALAIWNKPEKSLFIARDRLGIKPLYYHHQNGRFLFASELKSIIQDPVFSREINQQALSYFFSFSYIPAPYSIFSGINKLLPGHTLFFKDRKLKIQRYWDVRSSGILAKPKAIKEAEYIERIRYLLKQAVAKRLISDVPLGVFLSGGIDSSAVVAMMRQVNSGPIKTFSIGYGEKDKSFNELDYAQIVAQRFSTQHHSFIVQPQILQILPKAVWHLDEPFGDSSAILNFLISQKTREQITVALSGTAGDELFGGYPRYIGARLSLLYQKMPYLLRKIAAGKSSLIKDSSESRNVSSWVKRFLRGGIQSDQQRYIGWMQCFNKEEQRDLFTGQLKHDLLNFDPTDIHQGYFDDLDGEYLEKIFFLDLNTYLVDDLLHLGDRMSMASSLELRVPFCDHQLVEFASAIPYRMKLNNFQLKGLFKKALRGILPDIILDRKKQGFMVPVPRWLKEELREYTREVLSASNFKQMPFFNYSYIQAILDGHFSGKNNFAHKIWNLLVFKLWYDLYAKN